MKNKRFEIIILAVTLVFISFTAGFFVGRNTVKGSFTVETQTIIPNNDDSEKDDPTAYLININTADIETLAELPYIGNVIAQRIVDYREANGDFESIEDIKNVSGIGDSIYNEIYRFITVSDETAG